MKKRKIRILKGTIKTLEKEIRKWKDKYYDLKMNPEIKEKKSIEMIQDWVKYCPECGYYIDREALKDGI